jgi:hypothetical protein
MKLKMFKLSALALVFSASYAAHADVLTLEYQKTLPASLSSAPANFSPQGLGYDSDANELLFMQRGTKAIHRTDLNGALLGSSAMTKSHITSVSGYGGKYYFSDYGGNTSGYDLYSANKDGSDTTTVSSGVYAYGGMPIDVRDGMMYRTNDSTSYSWANLNQILVSSLSGVDQGVQAITLSTANGIGDIAVDTANNQVWTVDYSANALLRQYDLSTGSEIANYDLSLDGLTAGLTYADDTLYYYDWVNGASKLSAFSVTGASRFSTSSAGVGLSDVSAPAAFMGLSLMLMAGLRRKFTKS